MTKIEISHWFLFVSLLLGSPLAFAQRVYELNPQTGLFPFTDAPCQLPHSRLLHRTASLPDQKPLFEGKPGIQKGFYPLVVFMNDSTIQYRYSSNPNGLEDTVLSRMLLYGDWTNTGLTVTRFAVPGDMMLSRINYSWYRNAWVASEVLTREYFPNGLLQQEQFQIRENDTLKNVYLKEYLYYPDNDIKFVRIYADNNGSWKESAQYSYVHKRDGDQHVMEETEKTWINDTLVPFSRFTVKYQLKSVVSELFERWAGRNFVPVQRRTNYYNCQWYITGNLSEVFADTVWKPFTTEEFVYNRDNRLLYRTASKYEEPNWVMVEKITNDYNAEKLLCGNYKELWQQNNWVKTTGMKTEFDAFGNAVHGIGLHWQDSTWVSGDADIICEYNAGASTAYYFAKNLHITYNSVQAVDNADELVPTRLNLECFPNPFNPSTTIRYKVPAAGMVHIEIYTLLGRTVANLVHEYKNIGEYQTTFNGAHLASGLYICAIQCGQKTLQKKILLVK